MAKSVSLATRLKIAASLKGNKNAYRGGPKAKLSTRDKVANINARNSKALSPEQRSRRAAVAKRLRAQARKEESLGKTNSTPHAGVANKTPAMKDAGKRASGHIPKLNEQAPKKPSVDALPSKHPGLSKADNAELAHAKARIEQIDKRLAELDSKLKPKTESYDQRVARSKAQNLFSGAKSDQELKAALAAKAQGPDSQTSKGYAANTTLSLSQFEENQRIIQAARSKRIAEASAKLSQRTQAAPTNKPNRVDNKQAAANAVTKATSPRALAKQKRDLQKEIRDAENNGSHTRSRALRKALEELG